MAAVCAAFASRQLARSARNRLPQISRRGFLSTPFLTSTEPSTSSVDSPDTKSGPKVSFRPPPVKRGSLASGSIFADGEDFPKITTGGRTPKRRSEAAAEAEAQDGEAQTTIVDLSERDTASLERSLNPHPNRRARWQRKMVIRTIHRRGRLTRKEKIMQSERELSSKSHWFKTSVKKLGPLARQIAGKNIDEAILQMRYSKKKAAKDVKAFLEQAKNEAIVSRGMGLGQAEAQAAATETAEGEAQVEVTAVATADAARPVTLTLKDGKRLVVTDPTSIYIAQAWVGRGPFGREASPRGRGNTHILRPPYTSISVILKEEKTRIREWQEREQKDIRRRKAKVWRQLPDRPLTMRNQYYAW
ncbi:hypothetical protein CIRG_05433 [Coccidioides immitis RMSCC 2394]|uniref:Mitochondrial large ribosomal subunit n=4 Tax=Coccidioides TaxID=5500 RepID=E9D7F3_COCPS|nr:mitochondrial large ribosomal subunit [Coccidioides posadasii str. Silveira]KMM71044.1 hypothetical protein CPAG_07351 [Coccidioides posadasii RMSCC 3488]KMP05752.1 hypothetical protein CIRG_05433 [Coccidioides immitis RMSCC 2394]